MLTSSDLEALEDDQEALSEDQRGAAAPVGQLPFDGVESAAQLDQFVTNAVHGRMVADELADVGEAPSVSIVRSLSMILNGTRPVRSG
jgi:hypothetical protein